MESVASDSAGAESVNIDSSSRELDSVEYSGTQKSRLRRYGAGVVTAVFTAIDTLTLYPAELKAAEQSGADQSESTLLLNLDDDSHSA